MAQEEKQYRIVFMGTPLFAARILAKILSWRRGETVAVFTQPDAQAKRGHKTLPSHVKQFALERGLPILQPRSLKDPDTVATLAALRPDFLLVAAYGKIIPQTILSLPTFPPLNVHGSLLPRYRGAAPVQRAILEQYGEDAVTGVSIMQMVEALDAGPYFRQKEIPIANQTSDQLFAVMAEEGGSLLVDVMEDLADGTAVQHEQDESQATYAAKLEKKDGILNFAVPWEKVHARVRAVTSNPGAHTAFVLAGQTLQVTLEPGERGAACPGTEPGTLRFDKTELDIACADYWYVVSRIKPQGKAFMDAKAFINGYLRNLEPGVCGKAVYPAD